MKHIFFVFFNCFILCFVISIIALKEEKMDADDEPEIVDLETEEEETEQDESKTEEEQTEEDEVGRIKTEL